jgi:hypothetical protein
MNERHGHSSQHTGEDAPEQIVILRVVHALGRRMTPAVRILGPATDIVEAAIRDRSGWREGLALCYNSGAMNTKRTRGADGLFLDDLNLGLFG